MHHNAVNEKLTIIDAMSDPQLFGSWFKASSWDNWRVFLKALFCLPMLANDVKRFTEFTGRKSPPLGVREGWLVVGRRGGKSLIAALVAVFLGCFKDYREFLAPGERGTLMVIAADRKQSRVVMRYIMGFLDSVPMLASMIERRTKESVDLSNSVTIEVHTCSFRSTRGYSIIACIADEIAFWRSEDSANPDAEVVSAIRPGMASIPGSMLLCLSSPYARRGELWKTYQRYYGKDSPTLVWKAGTRSMNPTVPQSVIDKAYEEDPAAASAEYGAQFRRDIESFISEEVVEGLVVPNRRELPPLENVSYQAFCDPSGGSRDSMTLGIAHRENGTVILDAIRERIPPFSPQQVVAEFSKLLERYRMTEVTGDKYAGLWPREQFKNHGISYRTSDRTKSEIYVEFLPLLNSDQVELLDHKRLTSQLCGLERRTSRSGKDSIDHAPHSHDDVINAAAGAVVLAQKPVFRWCAV